MSFKGYLEGCREQCTMVIRLPRCCKGYFGRDCQGEGASYHLAILKGLCHLCAVSESTDAVEQGWGRGRRTALLPGTPPRNDPQATILKSCLAFLPLFLASYFVLYRAEILLCLNCHWVVRFCSAGQHQTFPMVLETPLFHF